MPRQPSGHEQKRTGTERMPSMGLAVLRLASHSVVKSWPLWGTVCQSGVYACIELCWSERPTSLPACLSRISPHDSCVLYCTESFTQCRGSCPNFGYRQCTQLLHNRGRDLYGKSMSNEPMHLTHQDKYKSRMQPQTALFFHDHEFWYECPFSPSR
ncbi:hypothetical protein BO86DRAFT_137959 [Aspergillus japonicus CBS 114.51]|uniref:Uncharacterized protein n=1 Tax=Aspergillus japonicus CBS 114.51 TaxID=1448312 RepID=A0A8T8XCY2_ASPJA|nr:hypothetical protein BO86DRAFT_137959 [Aspergillus japonicus CBS 114.51]RAH85975.1 hypothetical protein BO86DRAFT_137959 [Aspergillus japonicus CBS 114.51]